ncbi:alginate export family protein [Pseudomonas paralcaligenes]|uniref:alginate export family protein n=1 Tax=Pseudomonas paralcaligenes TaxID=2772558 RepID=UPI0021D38E8C|nr:alginate export family protein [Pseudomonas paralcaligenes]
MKRNTPSLGLALAIACGLGSIPAQAYELYNQDESILNADLEALFGVMRSSKNYDLLGNRDKGSSSWREGYVKYGLSGSQGLGGAGSLYGAFNLISSATWGDGDAAGVTEGSERRTAVEDAYLGWRSGNLLPWLGENGLDISGGRQVVAIGDGFLIQGDPVNFGDVDLGADFDRGGAYYLAARKAFDQTAVVRLGGSDGWRGDLIWLKSDNRYQAETELAIANLEHVDELGTLGLTWIHGLGVNQRFAEIIGLEERDGMDTVSLRGSGGLGVENLNLAAEYVTQDKDGGRENAWYLEGSWTFADVAWSPTATYRYSRFSEAFDPLFYGFSRGYGTWFQGEVAANYAGPFNSNAKVHHVGLKATPRENLTLGALFFDFDTLDTDRGNLGGRELDLYVEWMVNDHLLISPLIGFYQPERSAERGGLQLGGDGTNTYLQLIVGTFF